MRLRWRVGWSNLALVGAIAVLAYRFVLPHGSEPLGAAEAQPIAAPGHLTVVELSGST